MRQICLAVAGLCLASTVSAQQLYYSVTANLADREVQSVELGGAYIELMGPNFSPYYLPAVGTNDAFSMLAQTSAALSLQAMARWPSAEFRFSYDASATPSSQINRATSSTATYLGGAAVARLNNVDGTQLNLQARSPTMQVSNGKSLHQFTFEDGSSTYPPQPVLGGGALTYQNTSPQTFQIDLVTLVQTSSYNQGSFDLSAFSSLPIRVIEPTTYQANYMYFMLKGGKGSATGPWDVSPPNPLAPESYTATQSLIIGFNGEFSISLDAADYASAEAYAAASAWFASHPIRLDFDQDVTFDVASVSQKEGGWGGPLGLGEDWFAVSSVPEPSHWALFGAGLAALGCIARRRRAI